MKFKLKGENIGKYGFLLIIVIAFLGIVGFTTLPETITLMLTASLVLVTTKYSISTHELVKFQEIQIKRERIIDIIQNAISPLINKLKDNEDVFGKRIMSGWYINDSGEVIISKPILIIIDNDEAELIAKKFFGKNEQIASKINDYNKKIENFRAKFIEIVKEGFGEDFKSGIGKIRNEGFKDSQIFRYEHLALMYLINSMLASEEKFYEFIQFYIPQESKPWEEFKKSYIFNTTREKLISSVDELKSMCDDLLIFTKNLIVELIEIRENYADRFYISKDKYEIKTTR